MPKLRRRDQRWQSKRLWLKGYLLANLMDRITLEDEMDGEMHASCDACFHWADVEIVQGVFQEPKLHFMEHLTAQRRVDKSR